jgi:bifunctional non-homologous end joining protein LigD
MSKIMSSNRVINISNPDKLMFPDKGITKSDLVKYYQKISGYMLPYLKDRPLTLHRYPDGIESKDFYQKDEPDYFPDWIATIEVKLKSGGIRHMVNCLKEDTLIYLANQAMITPHIWLSHKDDLSKPDKLTFDLDPPEGNFEVVQQAAGDLKEILDTLGLPSFIMTTGSEGMHVLVPLDGKSKYDHTRDFAKSITYYLAKSNPELYTTELRVEKRNNRLFLDYLRNAYGQTTIAPYSLRARPCAPVATPLSWSEALEKKMSSRKYHYGNIFKRLARKEAPWKAFKDHAVSINDAKKKFEAMIK